VVIILIVVMVADDVLSNRNYSQLFGQLHTITIDLKIPPVPDVYSKHLQRLTLTLLGRNPETRPDALEVSFTVSRIRGIAYKCSDLELLDEVHLDHKSVIERVHEFQVKQDLVSSNSSCEDVTDTMVQTSANSYKDLSKVHRKLGKSFEQEQTITSSCGQSSLCVCEKDPAQWTDKLLLKETLSPRSSFLQANDKIDATFMESLAKESRDWLRKRYLTTDKYKVTSLK